MAIIKKSGVGNILSGTIDGVEYVLRYIIISTAKLRKSDRNDYLCKRILRKQTALFLSDDLKKKFSMIDQIIAYNKTFVA